MKISFENFGVIDKGEIEQKPLTILCGENNTGKTYAMYGLYRLLKIRSLRDFESLLNEITNDYHHKSDISFNLVDFITKNHSEIEKIINKNINDGLYRFFKSDDKKFSKNSILISTEKSKVIADSIKIKIGSYITDGDNNFIIDLRKESEDPILHIKLSSQNNIKIDKEDIIYSITTEILNLFIYTKYNTLILPAERAGLNLFYQEINAYRTSILHDAPYRGLRLKRDPVSQTANISTYPKPIADYIDWLNRTKHYKSLKSKFATSSTTLQKNILGGSYSFDETNNINFHLNNQKDTLPLHLTSSTVKTYFGLWFYLQHMAQEGDVLMIDEPELSLHPNNQRKIARLLAQLVNKGIRVVISTHSDYMVREFNSLIMLGHAQDEKSKQELMAKYNYQEDELLTKDKVGAYLFHNNTIDSMEITKDEGIIATTFDEVINELNQSSDDIYYSLKDSHE